MPRSDNDPNGTYGIVNLSGNVSPEGVARLRLDWQAEFVGPKDAYTVQIPEEAGGMTSAPAIHPNLDLTNHPYGYEVGWQDWQILRGSRGLSWLRWLLSFGRVTRFEYLELRNWQMNARRECHRYRGILYCYCDG